MNQRQSTVPVILQTGFRLFFFGAALQVVVSMILWFAFYVLQMNIFVAMPLTVWHGHEMIFGFSMAVVAGFLLTAVTNWTGLPTLSGWPMLGLFLLWLAARVLAFFPASFSLWPLAISDSLFVAALSFVVIRPIVAVKQWNQSAVFSKVILIFISNVVFYAALFNNHLIVERKALKFALYMIISLILTIGRRIMPFFIERGVGYAVTLRNSKGVDITSMILLLLFSVLDIFFTLPRVVSLVSFSLACVHIYRLSGWYTPGIWKKPLLWVLFWGYGFVIVGFLLKSFAPFNLKLEDASLHAFTAGGVGVMTLGMMARVAIGHTGRSIADGLPTLPTMFTLACLSAVIRIFFTLDQNSHFGIWIGVSQLFWVAAFGLYLISYVPILFSPRADGKMG